VIGSAHKSIGYVSCLFESVINFGKIKGATKGVSNATATSNNNINKITKQHQPQP
jgi:hypothetical protein